MDDESEVYAPDPICERAQAIRNISADLGTVTNRQARDLLMRAGEAVLLHMQPPTAAVVEIAARNGLTVKERPL